MTEIAEGTVTAGFVPGRLNIIMHRGQPWSLPLEWDDTNGSPMDLTGYTVDFAWVDVPPRSVLPPVPSVQVGNGIPNMVLSLSGDQLKDASFRAVGYAITVTDMAGVELPWLEGVVTLGGAGR